MRDQTPCVERESTGNLFCKATNPRNLQMNTYLKTIANCAAIFAAGSQMIGCAPIISGAMNATVTDQVVLEKTAKYFGVAPKDITVSGAEKGALATSYNTKFRGKLYNCSIYYGEVNCKQPGA